MVHTLVDQVREEAQGKILDMFYDKVSTRGVPTYEKVYNQTNLYCRSQRRDGFEQYTTHPVEQFHSTIKSVKEGSVVNLVSQLSMIELSAFNALSKENDVEEPTLSGFGLVIISLNIAMALTMKVEKQGRTYVVSQNKDYDVSLHRIFKDYMDGLKRKESYSRCRIAYIDSLIECVASEVTETTCSLCKQDTSYCYCPHILAVRLHVSFANMWETASKNGWAADDYVTPLLNHMSLAEVVQLSGCHSSLYRGEFNTKMKVLFEGCIYEPAVINRWSAQAAGFLLRLHNSAETYDTVKTVTGRRLNFLDRKAKKRRITVRNKRNGKKFRRTRFV